MRLWSGPPAWSTAWTSRKRSASSAGRGGSRPSGTRSTRSSRCTMPIAANAKSLEAIYQPIQGGLLRVEETLRTELRDVDGFLGEMTRYVSDMLGKRLRPALALFSAQACLSGTGYKPVPGTGFSVDRRVITMSASVELIHTATLIHDDVIDAAVLRRGQSTVNARWGNTLSVLAGDYLYAQAFCLLSEIRRA